MHAVFRRNGVQEPYFRFLAEVALNIVVAKVIQKNYAQI